MLRGLHIPIKMKHRHSKEIFFARDRGKDNTRKAFLKPMIRQMEGEVTKFNIQQAWNMV